MLGERGGIGSMSLELSSMIIAVSIEFPSGREGALRRLVADMRGIQACAAVRSGGSAQIPSIGGE